MSDFHYLFCHVILTSRSLPKFAVCVLVCSFIISMPNVAVLGIVMHREYMQFVSDMQFL